MLPTSQGREGNVDGCWGAKLNTADRNAGVEPGGDQNPGRARCLETVRRTQALSDVGMYLRAGEILALLGENGAASPL